MAKKGKSLETVIKQKSISQLRRQTNMHGKISGETSTEKPAQILNINMAMSHSSKNLKGTKSIKQPRVESTGSVEYIKSARRSARSPHSKLVAQRSPYKIGKSQNLSPNRQASVENPMKEIYSSILIRNGSENGSPNKLGESQIEKF
jgi:hypothetical protein